MDDITVGRHPVAERLEELRVQLGELAEFSVFGIPDYQLPELVCLARAASSQAQAVSSTSTKHPSPSTASSSSVADRRLGYRPALCS